MADLIIRSAQRAGVNPAYALALAVTESSLNPEATGDDGLSIGLFQLNRKFQSYTITQLLDPHINTDAAMVEILAVMRRFPGHTYGDYAEAWTLGGTGRFTKLRRNPAKVASMRRAISDLSLTLDLDEVPNV
jgi:soluble lytic murein transglycosylase-like protein